ncbi:adhesin-like protein [Reticulomyxa filosa]|uniref:Adhesin-like protein n=1 Tax=Reticulomyxa filosa TaxID=46433 RepID=X6NBQ5_RETFI|nr:adhesin-like protein [Reticulomyxa filosa]|eukprot:ETO23214.1 adhesin-like protein [Reticulomyxa filosa]
MIEIRPFGGSAMSSTMDDFIFVEDCVFTHNTGDKLGGAVFHNSGNLTFSRCTFTSNSADQGGAIGYYSPSSRLSLWDCVFEKNFASSQGGAVYIAEGNYDIINTTCRSNVAKSDGGCLYDGDGSFVCKSHQNHIFASHITQNSAQQGGGLYIHGCQFEMRNSTISENTASQTGGGAILDISSGSHHLHKITFRDNVAGSSGGAVTITGGNITLDACTIMENTAVTLAGAIHITHAAMWGLNVTLTNSSIHDNIADSGGAVAVTSSAPSSFLSGVIILWLSCLTMCFRKIWPIMVSNQLKFNNAKMEGGGVHVTDGWITDYASNFFKNTATNGGGLGCDIPLIQLSNTSFVQNTADNGGGVWLDVCPSFTFQGVNFNGNTATFSGGAIFVNDDSACKLCGANDANCKYSNNAASSGSNTGTGPQKLKLDYGTNIHSTFNQKSHVKIQGTLLDAYGQIVTQTEQTTVLSASILNADVELVGKYENTFSQGTASLDFVIVPGESFRHKKVQLNLQMLVFTSPYSLNKTLTLQFSNGIYAPQSWTVGINTTFGVLGIVSVLITAVLMWYYLQSPIIRGATPAFLAVILLGCLLLGISIILFPFMPQKVPCQLLAWLLHFSFVYIMAPITGKTWRIYMIFYTARKSLQRFNFTTTRLALFFIVTPSVIVFAYLLAWTLVQTKWTKWEVESNGNNKEYCSLDNIFLTVSLVCGLGILLWLVRLAIGVKDVPKNFNESFWLGASIYTLALIMLFMVPVSVITSVPPEAKQVLGGIASWIALEAVLAFLFWRKYYMIWFHSEEVKKVASPSEQSQMSSSGSGMAGSTISTGDTISTYKTTKSKTGNTLIRVGSNI